MNIDGERSRSLIWKDQRSFEWSGSFAKFRSFFVWGSDLSSYQDPSNDLDLCHDFSQKIRSKIKDHFQNKPTSGIPNSIPPFDNNDLP